MSQYYTTAFFMMWGSVRPGGTWEGRRKTYWINCLWTLVKLGEMCRGVVRRSAQKDGRETNPSYAGVQLDFL